MSGLAFIDVQDANPFVLFKEWHEEVADAGLLYFQMYSMCLATSTRDGKVSNRNVVIKKTDDDGFVFVTDRRGQKSQQINENPRVAATIMWSYAKDGKTITKQVRMEGNIIEIDDGRVQKIYDEEPLFCKIRSAVCHQSSEVDHKQLKEAHDRLLDEVLNDGKVLKKPEHYIGYKIVPERMDFYYSWDMNIADRVVFAKTGDKWEFVHVAA